MTPVLKKHSFHWRRAIGLAGCIPLLVCFAGCSSASKPKVKISYEDAPPPAAPAPQPVQAAATPAPAPSPAPETLPAAQETRPSTREAMEKALQWATDGLRAYQKGQWDTAHHNLDDARLLLLEADLPDFSKQQGLSVLQPGLPQELRSYDIEAVARELASKDKPDAAERLVQHLTTGEKAKFPDGHEEEHKIVKAKDPAEVRNLADWILIQ